MRKTIRQRADQIAQMDRFIYRRVKTTHNAFWRIRNNGYKGTLG
ncbi:hypothetical protein ACHOLT_11905 [Desulfitobacterium sp. Sab5]